MVMAMMMMMETISVCFTTMSCDAMRCDGINGDNSGDDRVLV